MHLLLIRADAGQQIGAGHVMRCLALAQAWQEQAGEVVYACAELPEAIQAKLQAMRIRVIMLDVAMGSPADQDATLALIDTLKPAWVVLDGYHFDADYQRNLVEKSGVPMLWVDDFGHAERYTAAIVLNQNLDADVELYASRSSTTRVLVGSNYAMLRREFLETPRPVRPIKAPEKLLVTLGGADPFNYSTFILKMLTGILRPAHHVTLVVSSRHAHLSTLGEMLANASYQGVLACDVSNMAQHMAQADLAISAAGSTCWEMAYMGLPSVLVTVAENQVPLAQAMANQAAAVYAGDRKQLSPAKLAAIVNDLLKNPANCHAMSANAARLVDGKGVARVVDAMRETSNPSNSD